MDVTASTGPGSSPYSFLFPPSKSIFISSLFSGVTQTTVPASLLVESNWLVSLSLITSHCPHLIVHSGVPGILPGVLDP